MFSVIVPVRNGAPEISEQLEALSQQTYPGEWELIVADNGSTDDTIELVRGAQSRFASLRVVDASGEEGAGPARNAGAAAATGDYLLFVDADDRTPPEWLEVMAKAAPSSDAIGGRTQRFHVDRRGERRTRYPSASLRSLGSSFMPFATGANCGVRADVFRELGGFRSELRVCEDADFFWRLQLAGYRLTGVEDSVVLLRDRTSARAWARQQYVWGVYQALLYREYASAGMPRRTLPQALLAAGDILLRTPLWMRSHYGRRRWISQLAITAGRCIGSARYHQRYF